VVAVLVILDGASEPLHDGEPTSLELARTPALDRLARAGELTRLRTVAPGLVAGSEAAIPALLGWMPTAPVDRGALEAAAHDVAVGPGERAWRVDVVGRPGAAAVARAVAALRAAAPSHAVHALRGHRLLVVGAPPLPLLAGPSPPPLRPAPAPLGPGVYRVWSSMDAKLDTPPGLRAWAEGVVPPIVLDARTVVIGARGAAVGAARLMGAATIVPDGATGVPGSDLGAKAVAALEAIAAGARRVVVHVGGADEAAHMRDRSAKVACIERADAQLVAPLAAAVARAAGTLMACPDHGCDPRTGAHDATPVPCVTWSPARSRDLPSAAPQRRLTERAVRDLPVAHLPSANLGVAA
jgi:2,3-bisphosphoglycerate-independent phosphoglycerate mutase